LFAASLEKDIISPVRCREGIRTAESSASMLISSGDDEMDCDTAEGSIELTQDFSSSYKKAYDLEVGI
jgi:hypothetical protein